MAEKLLQHALAAEGAPLNEIEVVSAGVAAGYGDPASGHSVAALRKVKLDLSHHQSQPLTDELIDQAFAIFGMADSHVNILNRYIPAGTVRIHLMREFLGNDDQIPDPFGQDFDAYNACLDSMIEAIPSLVQNLKSEYK